MNGEANAVKAVKLVFDSSLISAAVLDKNGSIIYKNKACTESLGENFNITADLSVSEPQERYINANGITYKLYSTPVEECAAVNLFPCQDKGDCCPSYFSSLARHMVSVITMAADNIADTDDADVYYDSLNAIEKTVMELQSRVMISDKIVEITETSLEEQKAVNISEAVSRFSSELSALTSDKPVRICLNARGGLFAKCDTEALTMLMSGFAAELIGEEKTPESVCVELDETCNERIALTIRSAAAVNGRVRDEQTARLISLMADVYDCIITDASEGGTRIFRADMPLCSGEMVLRSPRAAFRDEHTDRFSPVNIMLTAYGTKQSYGNKGKEN